MDLVQSGTRYCGVLPAQMRTRHPDGAWILAFPGRLL